MKTLIAAGLAASVLATASGASADPIYPVGYHHPIHHVVIRAPVAYRPGFARLGFYRTAYHVHGYRGAYHHAYYRRHGWGAWRHGPVHHHLAWRGTYVGEHHPA